MERPEKAGQVNDPNYYKFHKFISHPLKDYFIFEEKVNEMWKNGLITFDQAYEAKTVNMKGKTVITFWATSPYPNSRTNSNHLGSWIQGGNKLEREDGLVSIRTNTGEELWDHPGLLNGKGWETVKRKLPLSRKRKQRNRHWKNLHKQRKLKAQSSLPNQLGDTSP